MKKITDPSKLLPAAKSAAVTRTKRATIKPSSALVTRPKKESALVRTTEKSSALVKKENKSVEYVNVRLIAIGNLFRNDFTNVKKEAEEKRKEEEQKDFTKAEKKLETPKSRKLKFGGKGGDSPSIGFFDRLKRFLFFTALGWLLPKIIDFLPKLEGTLKTIGTVYKFAEGLFGKLFDGFMTLVKFGGDLKKQTLGFIAGMKGGDYQTEFTKLEKTFDTFVNASIIAGVLAADIGFAAADEFKRWRGKNKEIDEKRSRQPKGEKVTQGRGGRAVSAAGARAVSKVTQGKGGKVPGWWNKILRGPFAKLKGPLSKFAGAAVPGLGAVVGAADAKARFAAGDKIGGSLASVSAALDAATVVSALSGVGLPVAGVLGTISIGIDVLLLIRDIAKTFFPFIPMFSKGGRVVNQYQKGGVAKTTRRVPRPTTIKKPIKTKPPETKVGRDVGGERKIVEFYAKDGGSKERPAGGWLSRFNIFTGKFEDKEQNKPLDALKKTSKILKELPFGLGYFAGGAIDIALGQSMDVKKGLSQMSSGIAYMVDSLANQRVNMSMTSLIRDLNAFAEGGTIPASRALTNSYSSVSSGDLIAKVIGPTIEQKVNEAMQSIEKDLRSIQQKKSEQESPTAKDGLTPSGEVYIGGEFQEAGVGTNEMDLFIRMVYAEAGGEGQVGMALVARSILNRAGLVQSGKVSPGTFNAKGGTIQDIITARSQYSPMTDGRIRQRLTESQLKQAQRAIELAQNPNKLAEALKGEGLDSNTIARLMAGTGFRNYDAGAGYDPSQAVNEVRFKRHTFNTAGNTSLLVPKGVKLETATQRISGTPPEGVPLGESKVSQDISKFREFRTQFGGSRQRRPTFGPEYYQIREKGIYGSGNYQISPLADDTNYEINVHRGAGHWENRAFDIPVPSSSKEGDAVADYWRSRGYTVIWRSAGHYDHVHVEVPRNKAQEWFAINRTASKLAIKDGKEGVIENGTWRVKPWSAEEKQRYERASRPQSGASRQGSPPPRSAPNSKPKPQKSGNWWDVLNPANWGKSKPKPPKMQQGGIIKPRGTQLPIPNSYASYESPGGGTLIAIQPYIIEKPSYSSGNRTIAFPVPIGLNNTNKNLETLSRG